MPFLLLERNKMTARQCIDFSRPLVYTLFNLLQRAIIYLFLDLPSPHRPHEGKDHVSVLFTIAHTQDNVWTQELTV